jgi:hypothetical protein
VCDYRRGLYWLLTQLGTTSNHSAIVNFHNSQFTTTPAKPFPACCVLTSRSFATTSNSGDSSTSRVQVLSSPTLVRNCLPAIPSTEVDSQLFSASLAELNFTQHYQSQSQSQSHFTTGGLPPISSSWRQAPWDSRPGFFFLQLSPCGHSPYATSSLKGRWVCLLWIFLAFRQANGRTTKSQLYAFITTLHGPNRKHRFQQFPCCCLRIRCHGNVFTELLPNNERLSGSTVAAFRRHVTIRLRWVQNMVSSVWICIVTLKLNHSKLYRQFWERVGEIVSIPATLHNFTQEAQFNSRLRNWLLFLKILMVLPCPSWQMLG